MPPPAQLPSSNERFETLDALRGLAALAVVFWHWRHFYFDPAARVLPGLNDVSYPLDQLFGLLYRYGFLGVDLFFIISGFVFFHLYMKPIETGTVGGSRFAMLRVSRLYPLHLLTLLVVAGLQPLYTEQTGSFFVYQDNGTAAFVRQILFASNWGAQWPYSFNGPIWSVSIEVLLYLSFFIVARLGLTAPLWLSLFSIIGGLLILYGINWRLGQGVFSFFLGGLCLHFVQKFRLSHKINWSATAGLAIVIGISFAVQRITHAPTVPEWATKAIVFPALIIALACSESALKHASGYVRWLGNISYSSYLIHFPLQLLIVTVSVWLGWSIDYSSPVVLLAFVGALIWLSLLSFHCLEVPAQTYLRAFFHARSWLMKRVEP